MYQSKTMEDHLETSLDQSIDKTISAVVGYCKNILRVEQKKNDFMSEDLSSLNQGSYQTVC